MRRLEDWIDYMEGEGFLKRMGKLKLLLKHSLTDQVVLYNLRKIRRILKNIDPAKEIEDKISSEEFQVNFHAKTMERIFAYRQQVPRAKILPLNVMNRD